MKKIFSFLSKQNQNDVDEDMDEFEDMDEGMDMVEHYRRQEEEREREEEKRRKELEKLPVKDAPPPPRSEYAKAPGCYGSTDGSLQNLVIDLGSGMMKVGFGGDDAPRAVFPSIVGRPKNPEIMVGMDEKDHFVGDEAQAKRGILILEAPIKYGIITDWNLMEKILHHSMYNEMRVTPEEHPCFISEHSHTPKENRGKLTKMLFETFNTPSFFLAPRAVCSLYASGRTTGLCAGIGHSLQSFVPIYEGYSMHSAILRTNIGGKDVGDQLQKLLDERGYKMDTSAEREIVRDIKEKLCYISMDYRMELDKEQGNPDFCEFEYELPDGKKMTIGSERFRSPEILFKPSFIGDESVGFGENIFNCMQKCDIDVRKDLYQNISLWGGSTMFEGIVERVSCEVQMLGPKHARCKVNAPMERKFSSWIGGSIISSLSTFRNQWIVRAEYEEIGESVVLRKCYM